MTDGLAVSEAHGRSWWVRVMVALRWLLIVVALVTLMVAVFLWAMGDGDLTNVDPRTGDNFGRHIEGTEPASTLVVLVVIVAVAMVAVALPPVGPRLFDRPASGMQMVGGLVVGFFAVAGACFGNAFHFIDSTDTCAAAYCAPLPLETALVVAPAVLTAVLMIILGESGLRGAWWLRALAPAALWLALVGVQWLVWDPTVLNLLDSQIQTGR